MEKNKTAIIAVVGLVIIGLSVGGYMLMSDDDSSTETAVMTPAENKAAPAAANNEEDEVERANIVELASETSALSTLVTAVKAADLVETLSGKGPFTVFAPTNAAFEALPEGTLETLLKPENKEKLQGVLTYHVVSGKVMSTDLSDGQVVTTVQGEKLTINIEGGKVMLEDASGGKAEVVAADIEASNGVVHTIDSVVLPANN